MLFKLFIVGCWQLWTTSAWFVQNGSIWYDQTTLFHVRGLNWFGYETDCRIVHGLWINPIDHYFSLMRDNIGINTIRVPFSIETIQTWDSPPKSDCLTSNSWMNQISVKDSLHILFQKAAESQMAILLDFHTIGGDITDYLVSDAFTMTDTLWMWKNILEEFSHYENLIGIDLKNEPHGEISWDEWGGYASSVITYVMTQFPSFQGLFFIEGIQDRNSHSVWGGSFTDLHKRMMNIMPNNRVVFSPHIYGNSIRGDLANEDTYALFDYWFGHLRFKFPNNALVIGEIGGQNIGDDLNWHVKIKNYLKKRGFRDSFYWCLNPNSVDTGGILEYDWESLNDRKIVFLHDLQPNATLFSFPVTPGPVGNRR